MTREHSDLIVFACGRTLNLARVVTTEWYTPPAKRGKPAPARELMITTDILFTDKAGETAPWIIFVPDDDGGASALWALLQSYARPAPAPAPAVELAPFTLDEGEPPVGTSYRAAEAEVFIDARDDSAEPEVYGPWAGAVSLDRFLAAARAVEAITSDPRFMDRQHAPAPARFASAAD